MRGATEAARPNEAAREAVIAEHLKALKLPSFGREYQSLARRAADGGWAYEDYLRELLEVELHDREERTANRLLKAAKFPDLKTFDQLDWAALKGVSRQKIMQLASCEYLTKAEDVVLAGPIGTGKTHIAISLGIEAARRRFRVAFVRTSELVRSLLEAHDQKTLTRLHKRLERVDLLILDELWGSWRSSGPRESYSSSCSPNATNGARPSSRPTWHSESGWKSSATRS